MVSPECIVLILDSNSEISAHVRTNRKYLTLLRHSIISTAAKNAVFYRKIPSFLHTCATCSELFSDISRMPECFQIVVPKEPIYDMSSNVVFRFPCISQNFLLLTKRSLFHFIIISIVPCYMKARLI